MRPSGSRRSERASGGCPKPCSISQFVAGDVLETLLVQVDYDNVQPIHRGQGPVNLANMLMAALPANLLHPYDSVEVRLYGGWRDSVSLTAEGQRLAPLIRNSPPAPYQVTYIGSTKAIRVDVDLAQAPLGTRRVFSETLVRGREIRHFRSTPRPWPNCAAPSKCGMELLNDAHRGSRCRNEGCFAELGDVLVRDEQKMVDTLMVADLAYDIFVRNAKEVVIVSSDTDMWPGIHLALQAGRRITHVHTHQGGRTQQHLLQTLLAPMLANYRQLSL